MRGYDCEHMHITKTSSWLFRLELHSVGQVVKMSAFPCLGGGASTAASKQAQGRHTPGDHTPSQAHVPGTTPAHTRGPHTEPSACAA